MKAGKPVFEASAHARKSGTQPFRFVLFGDCGQGTPSENTVAYQAYLAKPDFLFIPGDIVYSSGRISEYRERFYPTYNADEPAATIGAATRELQFRLALIAAEIRAVAANGWNVPIVLQKSENAR